MKRNVAIVWKSGKHEAAVEVLNGALKQASARGKRTEIVIDDARVAPGPDSTLVTVNAAKNPFTFFLRDVSAKTPIFIEAYGVAVTEAKDPRGYDEIARDVKAIGGLTELGKIASEPEESFAAAAAATRDMKAPTWLGLTRDIRVFEVGFREWTQSWYWIQPRRHGYPVTLDDADKTPLRYHFLLGRGTGCAEHLTRRLDEGVLPILHGTQLEGDVEYRFTEFVTLETSPLTAGNLRGTHFRAADHFSHGLSPSDEDRRAMETALPGEIDRDEEPVLFFRAEAVNKGSVPKYAWFRNPFPAKDSSMVYRSTKTAFDGTTGFASMVSGGVFCVSRLAGAPMPQEEIAVLVPPGKRVTFEFVIPHRPISPERMEKLAAQDFDKRLDECRRFWRRKLAAAATVRLPEPGIDERVRAGLLHLDMITYGLEPDGPLAATVGTYSPIGSESSPIIQFVDSMGLHDIARRALDYFLEKQRPDGLMMNFGEYRLETGGVLWTLGEHWRYTRDDEWVRRIQPKVMKAVEFILAWRRRNMRDDLKGKGWGLVEGKVADPEDPFHSFMLNGLMVLGLARVAEMLGRVDPAESKRLAREADAFRRDVRKAFAETMARGPVVPLGDGTWVPTVAPWTEGRGPVCLFAEKGEWYTHGAFAARDSLIGAMYLTLQEILSPTERAAGFLLNYHAELMHERNVAMSQPYYSPHPFAHLARGEVKAFLKEYYSGVASLADRETYTFWEHYHHASPHKTHEEGWFLMQTRRMLWTEDGPTLRLLAGIPRAWMEPGKRIDIRHAASYFGPLTLGVRSRKGRIDAKVSLVGQTFLSDPVRTGKNACPPCQSVTLRLPHPQGLKAVRCVGGRYDAKSETVTVAPFKGRAEVSLWF